MISQEYFTLNLAEKTNFNVIAIAKIMYLTLKFILNLPNTGQKVLLTIKTSYLKIKHINS